MSTGETWAMIGGLAVLTYLIRFSFIGLMRGRRFPPAVMTALNHVPAAVLPAMVAPVVVFDRAAGGFGPAEGMIAAAAVIAVGMASRSVLWAIVAGFGAWHLARLAGV